MTVGKILVAALVLQGSMALGQQGLETIDGWKMQDVAKVSAAPAVVVGNIPRARSWASGSW